MRIPYWQLLFGPAGVFALGFFLNAVVVALNGGQMPVLFPGGCGNMSADDIHSCMTHATHLKFLADWILIRGIGVASPGDFLEWAAQFSFMPALVAWIVLIIKKFN